MASFTTVKKIGTSQTYTVLANWESDAPVDLTTSEKWSAGTFTGTFTQGETVTGTGLTAGKFLDSDGSSYVSFGIVTGNSATLVTLTGSSSLATCVVSSKTNTGCIWQGQINASTDNFSAVLTLAGSTASSTAYKELTTNTGASFRDNASVQSNALRYNTSNGCYISNSTANVISMNEASCRISNLQIESTRVTYSTSVISGSTAGTNIFIDNCIISYNGNNGQTATLSGATWTVRNCLLEQRLTAAARIFVCNTNATGAAYNCTFVVPSDLTAATNAFSTTQNLTMENCAFFGISGRVTAGGTITYTTCADPLGSPPSGVTQLTYDTSTGSGFQNISDATRDFRIKTGSGMLDVGTTDTTNAATDIAGTSRPQGSAYDLGCWELVVAAGIGIKTWDGVAQASVKNYMGLATASTKKWNGVSNV